MTMDNQEKVLGKITKADFGVREEQYGLFLEFKAGSYGVQQSIACWDYNKVKCTEYCNWTEKDRTTTLIDNAKHISSIISDAKINYISQLVGKPVELTFLNSLLTDWRILTEVL